VLRADLAYRQEQRRARRERVEELIGGDEGAIRCAGLRERSDEGVHGLAEIVGRTRQFAVRQERWFRRDPRIRWIDIDDEPVGTALPVLEDAWQTSS